MLLQHPVMPDGGFGTIFVCDFANVCSFDAVWVRRAGVVAWQMPVPGGGTWVGVAHCLLSLG